MIIGQASFSLAPTATPSGQARFSVSFTSEIPAVEPGALEPEAVETIRDYRVAHFDLAPSALSPWPAPGGTQILRYRITINGEELPADRRFSDLRVTTRLGAPSTWSLSVPLAAVWPERVGSPIGTVLDGQGSALGLDSVLIEILHVSGSQVLVYPLVTEGLELRTSENRSPDSQVLEISGSGPDARYEDEEVNFSGAGSTRAAILSNLAADAGITAIGAELRGRQERLIQVTDQPFRIAAESLVRPEGRVVHWDRLGLLTTPPAVIRSGRYDWTLTLDDVVGAQPGLSSSQPAPGVVIVTGTRQSPRADACGGRSTVRTIESISSSFDSPGRAVSIQDTGGGTTPVSTPATLSGVISRQIIREHRICNTLNYREVQVQSWLNPEAPVKVIDDTAGATSYRAVYLDANGNGRLLASPTFRLTSRSRHFRLFSVVTDPDGISRGRLTGERKVEASYHLTRAALKVRGGVAEPWDTADWRAGVFLLASGDGVEQTAEALTETSQTLATYFNTADDLVWQRIDQEQGFAAVPGSLYLFNGGGEGRESSEQFQTLKRSKKVWVRRGEDGASLIETLFDREGRPRVTVEDVDALPRSEVLQTDETAPIETQIIRARFDTKLQPWRLTRDETLADDFAETPAELMTIARTRASIGSAVTVDFSLLPHGGFLEGSFGLLDLGYRQIEVHVQEVSFSEERGRMDVKGLHYIV